EARSARPEVHEVARRLARYSGIAVVGRHADVAGGPSVARSERVQDLDAAAVGIEKCLRVLAESLVDAGRDLECIALLTVGGERQTRARARVATEIERVHRLAGGGVHAAGRGHPGADDGARRIPQLPRYGGGGAGDQRRALGSERQIPDLVDAQAGSGVGYIGRCSDAALEADVIDADRERALAANLKHDLTIAKSGRGRTVEREGLPLGGDRGGATGDHLEVARGVLEVRVDDDAAARPGLERQLVALADDRRDVVAADRRVPRVHRAGLRVDAERSLDQRWSRRDAVRVPGAQTRVEGAVRNLLRGMRGSRWCEEAGERGGCAERDARPSSVALVGGKRPVHGRPPLRSMRALS